jgi:hypothetical protein
LDVGPVGSHRIYYKGEGGGRGESCESKFVHGLF